MRRLALLAVLTALFAACGSRASDADQVCQRAADRYVQCVGELLGPEAKAVASAPEKDGRAACAADPRTVDAYRKCLPAADCDAFMDCTFAIAAGEP